MAKAVRKITVEYFHCPCRLYILGEHEGGGGFDPGRRNTANILLVLGAA